MNTIEIQELVDILPDTPIPVLDLIRVLDICVIIADQSGKIIYWNKGASKLFQYDYFEIKDKPLTIIMPERFREAHLKGIARMNNADVGLKSNMFGKSNKLFGLKKDQKEFPLELFLVTYKAKDTNCFLAVVNEVSETSDTDTPRIIKTITSIQVVMENIESRIEKITGCPYHPESESKSEPTTNKESCPYHHVSDPKKETVDGVDDNGLPLGKW